MSRQLLHIIIFVSIIVIFSGCSTTKKLGEDDVLYTGVKHLKYNMPKDEKIAPEAKSQIFDIINVKPNNPLYSPYYRIPFPLGLWVYNNLEVKSNKGFKHWIYEHLAEEPVLISDVRPDLRMEMIKTSLNNNGYFASSESYEVLYNKKNNKKAQISYSITPGTPYTLGEVKTFFDKSQMTSIIDSLANKNSYLKTGNRYCVDSLNAVRTNITNVLRNKGFFYFRPEYIEYLADSSIVKGKIDIRMVLASNIPSTAKIKYRTGKITTTINRNKGGGYADTIFTERGLVIQMKPSHLRKNLIPSCLTFKEGKTFSVNDMNRTQSYLSRLGIFNAINIEVETPTDTLNNRDQLDVHINCTFDAPLEATLELNASYKSNSYIGPAASVGLTHKNLFGGGEQLATNLTASYEWQTGKSSGNNSDFNYYELGITSTLSFPRLLAPKFIDRTHRNLNWTRINLSASILNHPNVLKVLQINTSFGYEWHTNRKSLHELTLFKLTYSKVLSFPDSLTDQSIAVLLNYRTEFIPQISYTYTFENSFGHKKKNNIVWKSTITEGGNIMAGIWSLAGSNGGEDTKELFGVPFSQFIKGQTQLVYSRRLNGKHYIVSRILVGAAHAYGNSSNIPYNEQFYIGGANSIRAFAARSIGPGAFNIESDAGAIYLRSGTFKFEMNIEYRFPIIGILNGALFVDAGNVWLFKDPYNVYYDLGGNAVLRGKTFFKEIALGTGVGLRVDLGMLVFRADLGIGIHTPYNTNDGYYNMSSFKNSMALNLAIGYPF